MLFRSWIPQAILITHGHADHTNSVVDLKKAYPDLRVYISMHELVMYKHLDTEIKEIEDDESLNFGNLKIKSLHTPGHSPGSQCFLIENNLFSGDTLFIDGCGNCKKTGANAQQLYNSLYHRLSILPDETMIYPGHDYSSKPADSLGNQRKTNPYFQCESATEFIALRLGL